MTREELAKLCIELPVSAFEITIVGIREEKVSFSIPQAFVKDLEGFPSPYRIIPHPRKEPDLIRITLI